LKKSSLGAQHYSALPYIPRKTISRRYIFPASPQNLASLKLMSCKRKRGQRASMNTGPEPQILRSAQASEKFYRRNLIKKKSH
jgi:hypothetical protein